MAVLGTAGAAQSSAVGPWCEVLVPASTISVAQTATAVHTVLLANPPAAPAQSSVLNVNLPIAAIVLATGTGGGIQGGSNTGLVATVGISQVTIAGTPATVSLTFANQATAYTLTTAARLILLQANGI